MNSVSLKTNKIKRNNNNPNGRRKKMMTLLLFCKCIKIVLNIFQRKLCRDYVPMTMQNIVLVGMNLNKKKFESLLYAFFQKK